MQFFILIIILGLVFFLYRLYHLADDDSLLVKKNITIEQLFNATFVISLVSLLFSRIFYVIDNPEPVFFGVLGFILFPYFPGLSITGAFLGAVIALLIISKNKKFPLGRVFDFFALSFLFVIPIGFLGYFLLSKGFTLGGLVECSAYVLILFTANIYLYPKSRSLEIKDGTISILFSIFFALISLLGLSIDNPGIKNFIYHKENYFLIIILILSIGLVIKQEIIERVPLKNGK